MLAGALAEAANIGGAASRAGLADTIVRGASAMEAGELGASSSSLLRTPRAAGGFGYGPGASVTGASATLVGEFGELGASLVDVALLGGGALAATFGAEAAALGTAALTFDGAASSMEGPRGASEVERNMSASAPVSSASSKSVHVRIGSDEGTLLGALLLA